MFLAGRISVLCITIAARAALRYVEEQRWWTFRLAVSCYIHGWALLALYSGIAAKTAWELLFEYDVAPPVRSLLVGLLTLSFVLLMFGLLIPVSQSRTYLLLRWKAWTGPSRTAVVPSMVRYIGGKDDWQALNAQLEEVNLHPTEVLWVFGGRFAKGIIADPTDLLKAQSKLDDETNTVWIPRSSEKESVYAPTNPDRPVSLLWGNHLGFSPRCSRGIISVPTRLLKFRPRLKSGVDGRPLCLAHGILARNKGLEPHRLICRLQSPESRKLFEENSSLWPLPAKTLQSVYSSEMENSFHRLGEDYVSAATQLAVLLADAEPMTVMDWLDAQLEHQDLKLNQQIASLGATDEELSRLYRGHYVAMLVSLSEHRAGVRIRPELIVYEALTRREGVREQPAWLSNSTIRARLNQETETFGNSGRLLVQAAL